MVVFNKWVLRLKLPNSSSVQEQNQMEPENFSQPVFWDLDVIGPRNDQMLKAAHHLSQMSVSTWQTILFYDLIKEVWFGDQETVWCGTIHQEKIIHSFELLICLLSYYHVPSTDAMAGVPG